jgi:flagellar L-ring protein precursor FlgH
MRIARVIAPLLATALLGAGCATPDPVLTPTPAFAPTMPVADPAPIATGSIFSGSGEDWFGRRRAYKIGDVLTVLLNESTQAARSQSTNTKRATKNDVLGSIMDGVRPTRGPLSQIKLDGSEISSEGTGSAGQEAKLTGSISVTIAEVLPNGNLVVRGEKQLALSEGSEFIQVAGIVRPQDVAPDGTVQSRRLANAQIAYRGTGELASASRPGWGTRVFQQFWPF